jgi:hypothetical protein
MYSMKPGKKRYPFFPEPSARPLGNMTVFYGSAAGSHGMTPLKRAFKRWAKLFTICEAGRGGQKNETKGEKLMTHVSLEPFHH